ncbi:unnamed protein product [Eruca vesicaria subsp. sativa]|uniref:Uncharacterized protein n=1 Tax=Eruca vesicaria subsp. sativa TaxID=29727 RepID=A0ABC8KVS6_ERUVS|nr:unnamed protein product [Eruca vesicaria subsp. sativa]
MSNAGRRNRRNICSLDSSTTMGSRKSKKKQVKVTSLKPFKLRTEQRGKVKEEEFTKKLQEITMVEEKMRIPIAQGLPWTTDEPEGEQTSNCATRSQVPHTATQENQMLQLIL